jgi:predicted RNA binding protein YcfA (HicA-like mRNA interferase family)
MGSIEKLLKKVENSPNNLNFDDFCTLMSKCGWIKDHQSGSHQIWYSSSGHRLSIQNRNGKAKSYQVKQFLLQQIKEAGVDNK